MWDLATGECQHILQGHISAMTAMAVAGGQVVSGSYDGTLRVWDLASGQCQHIFEGHTDTVNAIAVAGGQVVSGSYDGTLRVWDLAAGTCQHVLQGHRGAVRDVAVAGGRGWSPARTTARCGCGTWPVGGKWLGGRARPLSRPAMPGSSMRMLEVTDPASSSPLVMKVAASMS